MGILILYDGECGFCDRFIYFIARNDSRDQFRFISNTCEQAKELFLTYQINPEEAGKTILVIDQHNVFRKSAAIRKIFKNLPKFEYLNLFLGLIHPKILDFMYACFSSIRRKFISSNCRIPDKEIRKKFLC